MTVRPPAASWRLPIYCDSDIRNVIWVTADVHYCAAHYYPNKAVFQEFAPFWKFVAGPPN